MFDYSHVRTMIYLYKLYDLGYVYDHVIYMSTTRTTENKILKTIGIMTFPKLEGELTLKGGVIVTIFHSHT